MGELVGKYTCSSENKAQQTEAPGSFKQSQSWQQIYAVPLQITTSQQLQHFHYVHSHLNPRCREAQCQRTAGISELIPLVDFHLLCFHITCGIYKVRRHANYNHLIRCILIRSLPSYQIRSPGEGNGNPLQCSCLENPTDRGAWQATVHGVARAGHDLATKP